MTHDDFAELLTKIQHAERQVREAGQKEYARKQGNAFSNFERVADWLGIRRETCLLVYAFKHLDGIVAHVNDGHKSQREDISGRIKDARMYLALLWGMLVENEEAEPPVNGVNIGESAEMKMAEGEIKDVY